MTSSTSTTASYGTSVVRMRTSASLATVAVTPGGVRKLKRKVVSERNTAPATAGSGMPAAPITERVGRQVLLSSSSTSSSLTARVFPANGNDAPAPGCSAAATLVSSRRASGIGTFISGIVTSPVTGSSTRSSSCRMIRNELGTMPLATPECCG
jgi:hypothetical protein